jgi:hypothetical protein
MWEEDHAVIAESAPELVKEWENRVEKMGKEKAKGRCKKAAPKAKAAPIAKGAMTARKAVSKEEVVVAKRGSLS